MALTKSTQSILFPSPSFHVDLAALDALHPVHYSRRLLLFSCDQESREAQIEALQVGARALAQRCPILGGMVTGFHPQQTYNIVNLNWRTIVPGAGIELIISDQSDALPSFEVLAKQDFSVDKLPYDLLVPFPQDVGNEGVAACKLQYTAIEGGTILTWSMSHSVADGSGNNELMRLLAEAICRADGDASATAATIDIVGLDRSQIRNLTSNEPFRIQDHPGYMLNAPVGPAPHPFQTTRPEPPLTFTISASNLAKLKADAQHVDAPPISTHDAMCALIWRTTILIRSQRSPEARNIPPDSETQLFFPTDGRRHLRLPLSYIGNAVYQLKVTLPLSEVLSATGLQLTASAVRRAINAITPDKVRSIMAETNKKWTDWAFIASYNSTGVAMGTDWTSHEVYQHDWGKAFGKLKAFRYPGEEGTNVIFPKRRDGGADIVIAACEDEHDTVKEAFAPYI
jgi:trichothecene 3-O-acetyltransferase